MNVNLFERNCITIKTLRFVTGAPGAAAPGAAPVTPVKGGLIMGCPIKGCPIMGCIMGAPGPPAAG